MSDETSVHRQTVNILQACAVAGVSRRTIYNWLKAGNLEYMRTAGGSVRIYTDTLFRPGTPGVPIKVASMLPKQVPAEPVARHTHDFQYDRVINEHVCDCGKVRSERDLDAMETHGA